MNPPGSSPPPLPLSSGPWSLSLIAFGVRGFRLCAVLGVFAGASCCGFGQGDVSLGLPAGADVLPLTDNESGCVFVVGKELRLERGKVQRFPSPLGLGRDGLPAFACSTQSAEGDGVPAGLGGEMPPEP